MLFFCFRERNTMLLIQYMSSDMKMCSFSSVWSSCRLAQAEPGSKTEQKQTGLLRPRLRIHTSFLYPHSTGQSRNKDDLDSRGKKIDFTSLDEPQRVLIRGEVNHWGCLHNLLIILFDFFPFLAEFWGTLDTAKGTSQYPGEDRGRVPWCLC